MPAADSGALAFCNSVSILLFCITTTSVICSAAELFAEHPLKRQIMHEKHNAKILLYTITSEKKSNIIYDFNNFILKKQ